MSDQAQQQIDHAARAYLAIQDALTRDTLDGVDEPLVQLAEAAMHLDHLGSPDLQQLATAVQTAAKIETRELDAFREAFGPLSDAMIALLSEAPPTAAVSETVYVTHCPMVNRDWLQATPAIRNPYATTMLECGSVERAIAALPAASPTPDVGETK